MDKDVFEQISSYALYLKCVHRQLLDKYFKNQAPYLKCKEGCAYCCQNGEYPASKIEVQYLMFGLSKLPKETQEIVYDNIRKLISLKENSEKNKEERFFYECPFLINDRCCVYEYRMLICRTHGLMFFMDDNKQKIPACVNIGLNYSNVYDLETKTISEEKWIKSEIKQKPIAYNLSQKVLKDKSLTEKLDFTFSENKSLIDWFL